MSSLFLRAMAHLLSLFASLLILSVATDGFPPFAAAEAAEGGGIMSAGVVGETNQMERIALLHKAWATAYGLDHPSLLPPKAVSLPRHLPLPPHLDDCAARTGVRQGAERAGAAWAAMGGNGSSCCGCSPQPPWVYGPDDNNLAMTRTAQRDIWTSQFPAGSCEGKRLLLAPWLQVAPSAAGQEQQREGSGGDGEELEGQGGGLEGLGRAVHVMGALLGLAVESGRVLVPLQGSFQHANNSACKAVGQHGQWECFFSPIASSDCAKLAQKAVQSGALKCGAKHIRNIALSAEPTVCLHPEFDYNELKMQAAVVSKWGSPHLQRPDTLYRPTAAAPTPDNPSLSVPQVRWWRAQATRFLMRWPSLHLCHVINLVRHVSTSQHVAARLAFFDDTQAEIVRHVAADTAGEGARADIKKSKQATELSQREMGKGMEKEAVGRASWATNGGRCAVCEQEGEKGEEGGIGSDGSVVAGGAMSAEEERKRQEEMEKRQRNVLYHVQKQNELVAGVGREPYIMRPLVSLIIGGTTAEGKAAVGEGEGAEGGSAGGDVVVGDVSGGNGAEGKEVEGSGTRVEVLSSHMLQAHQLRLVEPHLDHVWLHSQSQAVISSASSYHAWAFLHATNHTSPLTASLQDTASPAADAAAAGGVAPTAAGRALASLLVASQGDFFVGGLRSHWGRLVNELRSTNGRLFNVFVAMDDEEW